MYSQERIADSSDKENSFEANLSIRYDLFQYDTPEIDVSTVLSIIPNLTESGRVRANWDISFKWELYEDLFWSLSFYDSFDSDPPSLNADRNDYGIVTGLGWDF